MSSPAMPAESTSSSKRVVEATIHIGAILILGAWCFKIVYPFIIPLAWGIIIAVALHPGYQRMCRVLGDRRVLSAALVTSLLLFVLIVPSVLMGHSLVEGAETVARHFRDGSFVVPPPPKGVAAWPFIGEPVERFWSMASSNLEATLKQLAPHLKPLAASLLGAVAGAGLAVVQFVLAILVAGVLLAKAEAGERFALAFATRLTGPQGPDLIDLARSTLRSVTRGILGVAFIQATLIGLGFLVMGVPAAGLWALICLILGVIQLPLALVQVPVVIYVFSTASTGAAVAFLVWNVLIAPLDSVLKPILLGRGVQTPMFVVFVGAIGGFIASGIIGLFVGAVVLTLAYKLLLAWLDETTDNRSTGTMPLPRSESAQSTPEH